MKKIIKCMFICVIMVANLSAINDSTFKGFVLDSGLIKNQKFNKAILEKEGEELIGLLDFILNGLQLGKVNLVHVGEAFSDLFDVIGNIDKPKAHHIRELEAKIKVIVELLDGDDTFDLEDAELVQKIRIFIELFENYLSLLDIGGVVSNIVDTVYYQPVEWLSQYKYGKQIASGITGTVVLTAAGLAVYFKIGKINNNKDIELVVISSDNVDLVVSDDSFKKESETRFVRRSNRRNALKPEGFYSDFNKRGCIKKK